MAKRCLRAVLAAARRLREEISAKSGRKIEKVGGSSALPDDVIGGGGIDFGRDSPKGGDGLGLHEKVGGVLVFIVFCLFVARRKAGAEVVLRWESNCFFAGIAIFTDVVGCCITRELCSKTGHVHPE